MNSKGIERPVLFYKYLRGWREKFDKTSYESKKKDLGLNVYRERIGKKLSAKLKKFLKDSRKRRLQNST